MYTLNKNICFIKAESLKIRTERNDFVMSLGWKMLKEETLCLKCYFLVSI